jgi:uncharacterized membrane protein YfcA
MSNELLFYAVVLIANIFQGITGFAGTVLAMPASLFLVGYGVAKPVLNVFGFFSGIYVFAGNHSNVDTKVLTKILLIMGMGVAGGILIKSLVDIHARWLYIVLGIFVSAVACYGLFAKKKEKRTGSPVQNLLDGILLLSAGIIHGIFVCGGPLVITYLTNRLPDKTKFRATISTVWIVFNGVIMITDILSGAFTAPVIKELCIATPFLLGGMYAGSVLVQKMDQSFFMKLTYVLLLVSGISLLVK